jgi:hypothetical protein
MKLSKDDLASLKSSGVDGVPRDDEGNIPLKENLSPSPRRTKYRIPLDPIPHPRSLMVC